MGTFYQAIDWRRFTISVVLGVVVATASNAAAPIRVLVWDEQQPVDPPVYPSFPGNYIADHLGKNDRLSVTSASLDDPDQGLASEALRATEVLVYWGHVRHREISEQKAREIADLIKEGRLAMIALHSAHWSMPFMIAMQEKAAQDALERLPEEHRAKTRIHFKGEIDWHKPGDYKRNFISTEYVARNDGTIDVFVERPACVFPRCCTPMQPSQIRIVNPSHPIVRGVPKLFTLPATEMYDEPFHVPEPDELVLDETWDGGEYFRSGMLWKLGRGHVFYFRPGDQQYPVYKEKHVLTILENACLWLGDTNEPREK